MTRDPLTDPQPGDVVRARDADGLAVWLVESRDGDDVTLRGMALDERWTWTETLAKWSDWTEWQGVTAIPAEAVAPDPLDSARLAAEAAEAEVRALTEALAAARRRSLEAYAEWVSAVQRGHADALRALRS